MGKAAIYTAQNRSSFALGPGANICPQYAVTVWGAKNPITLLMPHVHTRV
jgi:hypothetical protein